MAEGATWFSTSRCLSVYPLRHPLHRTTTHSVVELIARVYLPPNGWRVSGELRGEAEERVRCTRVLGGPEPAHQVGFLAYSSARPISAASLAKAS